MKSHLLVCLGKYLPTYLPIFALRSFILDGKKKSMDSVMQCNTQSPWKEASSIHSLALNERMNARSELPPVICHLWGYLLGGRLPMGGGFHSRYLYIYIVVSEGRWNIY